MKTATFPSLRVDPALREAAEAVLQEGETLSGFVEESIRVQIDKRRVQEEFIARGLASRESAKSNGDYTSSAIVLKNLESRLSKAKKRRP